MNPVLSILGGHEEGGGARESAKGCNQCGGQLDPATRSVLRSISEVGTLYRCEILQPIHSPPRRRKQRGLHSHKSSVATAPLRESNKNATLGVQNTGSSVADIQVSAKVPGREALNAPPRLLSRAHAGKVNPVTVNNANCGRYGTDGKITWPLSGARLHVLPGKPPSPVSV